MGYEAYFLSFYTKNTFSFVVLINFTPLGILLLIQLKMAKLLFLELNKKSDLRRPNQKFS